MTDANSDAPQISVLGLRIAAAVLIIVPLIAVSICSYVYFWRNPGRRKISITVNIVQFSVIAVLLIICIIGITFVILDKK